MSFLDTLSWYYGYISIYIFLFAFLNFDSLSIPYIGSFNCYNAGYDKPFDGSDLVMHVISVSLWCMHHSLFVREFMDKSMSQLPLDAGTSYQIMSATLLNFVTYVWCCASPQNEIHGGLLWDVTPTPATADTLGGRFLSRNVLCIISLLYYTYTEYYALTSGIYDKKAIVLDGPYTIIRHPMQLSFLCIFWLTPLMSVRRFILVVLLTIYVFIGIHFEEKDLARKFGKSYIKYQRIVPRVLPYRAFVGENLEDAMKKM